MAEFRIEKVNTLPVSLTADTVYVVQNGAFSEIYISNTAGTSVKKVNINHNDSFNKQGGDGTNFYHLGEDDYNNLQDIINPISDWISSSATEANSWTGITFALDIFVAVSSTGTNQIMTSSDGITWIARSASESSNWGGITYGNGLFIALSSFSKLMTSPDGITWTSRTVPALTECSKIAFGNGIFIGVAQVVGKDKIIRSTDGITWVSYTVSANRWSGITYGNGLFVAVSYDGANRVMTSPDGITWTNRLDGGILGDWNSVTYGNGLFVAVGSFGATRVMTSPDGITWTGRDASENLQWKSVIYAGGYFVAVSQSGINQAMRSIDGINWLSETTPDSNIFWQEVSYGTNKWVAVSASGTDRVMYSTLNKIIKHSNIDLDDGRNPHETRYEDLLGTTPSSDRNVDGGAANSVYLPSQIIDGGIA